MFGYFPYDQMLSILLQDSNFITVLILLITPSIKFNWIPLSEYKSLRSLKSNPFNPIKNTFNPCYKKSIFLFHIFLFAFLALQFILIFSFRLLNSTMKLTSKIISSDTQHLKKSLKCYFDHNFELIPRQCGGAQPSRSLSQHLILPYVLAAYRKTTQNSCILVYKYHVHVEEVFRMGGEAGVEKMEVIEYDPKVRVMKKWSKKEEGNTGRNQIGEESTVIIELFGVNRTMKVFLLPFSRGKKQVFITRAIHENFKMLKIIKQFLSFDESWKGNLEFQEPILQYLSSYLYEGRVKQVQIVLWVEEDHFDQKLIQQVGQLKLPQKWLEKDSYRLKKQEMFKIKHQNHQLLNCFRFQKDQFTKNINNLQVLSGIAAQNYEQINLQSLKHLKSQDFTEKATEIKDLQNLLNKLKQKEEGLQNKKISYEMKRIQTQKKHVSQIMQLKRQISFLQQQTKWQSPCSSGLIFSRSKKSTDQKVIKTIFTNMDKQAKRIIDPFNRNSDNSDNHSIVNKNKNIFLKQQFKNNGKKVACVTKEGKQGIQVDKKQLREDYQTQIMKIDFQMQKRYSEMLSRYEQAGKSIKNVIEENQELNI